MHAGPIRSEDDPLDAVVIGIEHMNPAESVDGESPGAVKSAGDILSGTAPAAERFTGGRELLHAMVAVLDDVEDALGS